MEQSKASCGSQDQHYAAIAHATQQRMAWPQILKRGQWKWRENVRNFSLYIMREGTSCSVLASGVVNASVREIASLLLASSQDEYDAKMVGLYGKEYKFGTYIAEVETEERTNTRLSIRSATFPSPGWLRGEEAWCYLNAEWYDEENDRLEIQLTSMKMEEEFARTGVQVTKRKGPSTIQSVICGYRIEPEESSKDGESPRQARVHFYAEYGPVRSKGRTRSTKEDMINRRMLSLARSSERLSILVRRRRIGVQVLMDTRRVPSLANHKCVNCEKIQLIAKLCRMCGNGVCKNCSDKYERETRHSFTTKGTIDMVRICDPCLTRIESGDYSNTTTQSLCGPFVIPDQDRRNDLKNLLRDALLQAPSPQRKDAVRSVIQCVLDLEQDNRVRSKSSVSTTTASSDPDDLSSLDGLSVTNVCNAKAELSGRHGRSYVLNPHDPSIIPISDNETHRLRVIENLGVLTHGTWDELDIVCELAAREIGALASIVSIITKDEQRVVAANHTQFKAVHPKRERSFCTHTIMENRPLIVAHPEADYRIGHIARMWKLGVRFYCGFPLIAEDKTVIGTLCCVDQKSRELTETQYNVLLRLATTAAKIIQHAAKTRSRTSS